MEEFERENNGMAEHTEQTPLPASQSLYLLNPVPEYENNPPHQGQTARDPVRRRPGRRIQKKKHSRWYGVAAFLSGMAAAGLLAAAARTWTPEIRWRPDDRFSWEYRSGDEDDDWSGTSGIFLPAATRSDSVTFTVLAEHGESRTAPEVYRQVNPSVVTVVVELDGGGSALGTGVIFTEDGYFLTNYHVIDGGRECVAVLDNGRRYRSLYVAGDEGQDLAILKMELPEDEDPVPAAEFGNSDLLSVGDKVYAIGNPLGVEFRGTFTDGIVSAVDRDVAVEGRVMTLIQTNAALNVGNSGGPLINEYGQVVGINVVKMSSSRSTVEGLGFAIPSAGMYRLVNDLLTYGEIQPEPLLGVVVYSECQEAADGVWGLYVESVEPDYPAAKAGVLAGDYILSAGGIPMTSSHDLLWARRHCYSGGELTLILWRNGEQLEVTLRFPEE